MNSIEITFGNPWLLLLAIPSLAIILIPYLRIPKKRRNSIRKRIPVILHVIIVLLLTLILSEFHFVQTSDEQAVVLLVDLSGSTRQVQDEIEEHAKEILELMNKKTPAGVVVFGENQVYSMKMNAGKKQLKLAEVSEAATNIEGALEYAITLLPDDKVGRVILLSDGKENVGDAEHAARYLATQNVRVDAMYFDTVEISTPEVQISSLSVAKGAYVGEELSFTAEIESNVEGTSTISLYDGEKLLQSLEKELSEGSNLFEFSIMAEEATEHTYRLCVEAAEDGVEENNESSVRVNIIEKPSVLIIASLYSDTFKLEELLESEYAVTSTIPSKAPQTLEELCAYDQIILSNVDYEDFAQGYDKLLEAYVNEHGRNLLVAGGGDTMMYGHMEGTAIEEMLPVSLTLSEDAEAKSVALMLVIDCSSSMSRRSTYLQVAKQGAINCVNAMTGNDYIGVVTFNRVATLNSPLILGTEKNKESLNQMISRLRTDGGTFYNEALRKAHEELKQSSADIKHIMFLSDGAPSDRDFFGTISDIAKDGITISAIGLGYTSGILTSMAESGGGRYYYVENAEKLPDIMLSETEQVVVSSLKRGEFQVVVNEESELTKDLGSMKLPILTGYLGTTLKEEATAYLTTEDGNPIYAEWAYGAGTVGCFTSDLKGSWSAEWFKNNRCREMIKKMVSIHIGDYLRNPQVVECVAEYDAFAPSGEGLLIDLCNQSQGEIYEDVTKLAKATVAPRTSIIQPMEVLGIVSMVLLLADIAIRKLSLARLKLLLGRIKQKIKGTE